MSEKVLKYLKDNQEELLFKLNEFLSIPSISTDSKYTNDVNRACNFLVTDLKDIQF